MKKGVKLAIGVAICLLLVVSLAITKEKEKSKASQLPAEVKRLEAFIGNWTNTGTLTTDNKTSKAKGKCKMEKVLGGWGVGFGCTYEIEGIGTLDERGYWAYDQEEGKTHMFVMTNSGDARDFKGSWLDDKNLTIKYDSVKDGKPQTIEVALKFIKPNELVMHEERKLDGKLTTTIDNIYKK